MALKNKTLATQLSNKAISLRAKQDAEFSRSKALQQASIDAAESSAVAADHAFAVERAVAILDEAGVTL